MKGKKGEKLISVYWFLILVVVAVGVVLMANAYYGNSYDVRKVESEILANKVADCVYLGGKVNPLIFSSQDSIRDDFRDRFLEICSLNFDTGELVSPYYVEMTFSSFESSKPQFIISKGNENYKSDCDIGVSENDNLAQCTEKQFYMKLNSEKIYLVKILSVVGKTLE